MSNNGNWRGLGSFLGAVRSGTVTLAGSVVSIFVTRGTASTGAGVALEAEATAPSVSERLASKANLLCVLRRGAVASLFDALKGIESFRRLASVSFLSLSLLSFSLFSFSLFFLSLSLFSFSCFPSYLGKSYLLGLSQGTVLSSLVIRNAV